MHIEEFAAFGLGRLGIGQKLFGMFGAGMDDMLGVSRFEDLDVYKLAVQLRGDVFQLTSAGAAARDFRFVDQIRDAVRGGPRNIAEGFSRFVPSEFAHFLSYAKASIDETSAHIQDARERGYFSREECDRLLILVRRTTGAINGLMAYLDSPTAARAYERIRQQRRTRPHIKRRPGTREP